MREARHVSRWVKLALAASVGVIVGGLGVLGLTLGRNTATVDQVRAVQHRQRVAATAAAVSACRAVQHTNQALEALLDVLNTGTRAGSPLVVRFEQVVTAIERDGHLCDVAAGLVGHPIRPKPLPAP